MESLCILTFSISLQSSKDSHTLVLLVAFIEMIQCKKVSIGKIFFRAGVSQHENNIA